MRKKEINRLKHLLNMETAKFMDAKSKVFQLSKDLLEMRFLLERQKCQNETYINQGKEKKRDCFLGVKHNEAQQEQIVVKRL